MLEENKKLMSILKEEGKYIIDETTGATKKKRILRTRLSSRKLKIWQLKLEKGTIEEELEDKSYRKQSETTKDETGERKQEQ